MNQSFFYIKIVDSLCCDFKFFSRKKTNKIQQKFSHCQVLGQNKHKISSSHYHKLQTNGQALTIDVRYYSFGELPPSPPPTSSRYATADVVSYLCISETWSIYTVRSFNLVRSSNINKFIITVPVLQK